MIPNRNFVLVDIDHCVSNAFHRDGMIGTTSWDAYHEASVNDDPIHDIVILVRALRASGLTIVGITARPAKFRQMTTEFLVRHGVPFDEMLMRPDEEFRPSGEMKPALAIERFGSEEAVRGNVAFIIDDHEGVMTAFRAMGITCLQVFARRV